MKLKGPDAGAEATAKREGILEVFRDQTASNWPKMLRNTRLGKWA